MSSIQQQQAHRTGSASMQSGPQSASIYAGSASIPRPHQNTIGLSMGGSKDVNNFRKCIEENIMPSINSITCNGLLYQYYFNTETRKCIDTEIEEKINNGHGNEEEFRKANEELLKEISLMTQQNKELRDQNDELQEKAEELQKDKQILEDAEEKPKEKKKEKRRDGKIRNICGGHAVD